MPFIAHPAAGELLAIEEFNSRHEKRFTIAPWHLVRGGRPFPEREYLDGMFVLHDLEAISRSAVKRETRQLELRQSR
jgi:hypothetical protein